MFFPLHHKAEGKGGGRTEICAWVVPCVCSLTHGTASGGMNEGDIVKVSGGKYDEKTGRVASVAAKTCTLIIDGEKTGNIALDAVSREAAGGATTPAPKKTAAARIASMRRCALTPSANQSCSVRLT